MVYRPAGTPQCILRGTLARWEDQERACPPDFRETLKDFSVHRQDSVAGQNHKLAIERLQHNLDKIPYFLRFVDCPLCARRYYRHIDYSFRLAWHLDRSSYRRSNANSDTRGQVQRSDHSES